MDDIDRAQELAHAHVEKALTEHRRALSHALGREDCIDCGYTIPKERKKANPNAQRCSDCQADFEGN